MTVRESLMRMPEPYGEMAVKNLLISERSECLLMISQILVSLCTWWAGEMDAEFWEAIYLDAIYHEQNEIPFK